MITSLTLKDKIQYQISLRNANMSIISDIPSEFMGEIDIQLNDISSISIRIPNKVPIANKMVTYPIFDEIKTDRLITINDKYCFSIKNIEISEDGEKVYKELKAYSLEKKLERRTIALSEDSYRLKSNDTDKSNSIFDLLEQQTNWTLGHIDESALNETIDEKTDYKYRFFETGDKTWSSFLKDEITKLYNVQLFFDSYNKIINVYDKDNFGEHKGLYLSNENFLKSVRKSIDGDQIITRLHLTGKDGITITDVNPLGTDYIEDFTYYIDNQIMSGELISSLARYKIVLDEKQITWQGYNTSLTTLRETYSTKNTELTAKKEELKAKELLKNAYITAEDNESLTKINSEILVLNNKITVLTNEIAYVNSQITTITDEIATLVTFIQKENISDNVGIIFDSVLLQEIDNYISEDSWSDENYLTSTTLYEAGVKELKDKNTPPIEDSLELVDFLSCIKHPQSWDYMLKLGDYVTIDSKINNNIDLRFIGYKHNPNDNKLSISLSNKDIKINSFLALAKITKIMNTHSQTINNYKTTWKASGENNTFVKDIINNGVDLSNNTIVGQSENNKTEINDKGFTTGGVGEGEKNQIFIGSGKVSATNDNWDSTKILISSEGIHGSGIIKKSVEQDKLSQSVQDILTDVVNAKKDKDTLEEKIDDIDVRIDDILNIQYTSNLNYIKTPVRVATITNLSVTYSEGVLTSSANELIKIDNIDLIVNDRVLVKNQTDGSQNGIYYVSDIGGISKPWKLIRSNDVNTTAEVIGGMSVWVNEGDDNKDTRWSVSTDNPIVLDDTSLIFIKDFQASDMPTNLSQFVNDMGFIRQIINTNQPTGNALGRVWIQIL